VARRSLLSRRISSSGRSSGFSIPFRGSSRCWFRVHPQRIVSPLLLLFECQRRVDEPDMAEALGEVAEERAGSGIDLFAEEADIVTALEKSLEESVGLVAAAHAGEGFD